MIEKLNVAYIQAESDSNAKLELANKINELVDAVNLLQCKNIHIESNLQDLMYPKEIKCEPAENGKSSKMEQDIFAEQRKWIGCVCRFWYDNPDDTVLDYLGKIQTGKNGIEYYGKETYDWFPHCEPVKPDDDIIYKGE